MSAQRSGLSRYHIWNAYYLAIENGPIESRILNLRVVSPMLSYDLPCDSLSDTKSCTNSTVLNPTLITFVDVSCVFEL